MSSPSLHVHWLHTQKNGQRYVMAKSDNASSLGICACQVITGRKIVNSVHHFRWQLTPQQPFIFRYKYINLPLHSHFCIERRYTSQHGVKDSIANDIDEDVHYRAVSKQVIHLDSSTDRFSNTDGDLPGFYNCHKSSKPRYPNTYYPPTRSLISGEHHHRGT